MNLNPKLIERYQQVRNLVRRLNRDRIAGDLTQDQVNDLLSPETIQNHVDGLPADKEAVAETETVSETELAEFED